MFVVIHQTSIQCFLSQSRIAQMCLMERPEVNHGMLTCLQRFLSSKDVTFVQQLCAACGEPGASTNREGDAAEFLARLLATLKSDFPMIGDLFGVRVSVEVTCSACETEARESVTRVMLVVPGGCTSGNEPLSLSAAFDAAAENACQQLSNLLMRCSVCFTVCFSHDSTALTLVSCC